MQLVQLAGPLVDASISLFHELQKNLLPTPKKSHYTFNLRDLSKASLPARAPAHGCL